eukprot:gene14824-31478_t
MAIIDIKVPDIGDFAEVAIIEVLVKPGDTIKAEQSLITVESDKASMEIPSSHAGVVKELKVKLGDKIAEGSVVLTLEVQGAGAAAPAPMEETTGSAQEKTGVKKVIAFKNCIIAAGSQAVRLPFMPDDLRLVDSTVSGCGSHLAGMRGHMHTPEIRMPHPGRRRGRYSNDFKRQVVAACLAPGVSTAAIALSNGLNANLLRRWVGGLNWGCLCPCRSTWTHAMQKSTEVLGGLVVGHKSDGRCTYDPQVKQELIRQCLKPGVSVASTALQDGLHTNPLRTCTASAPRATAELLS